MRWSTEVPVLALVIAVACALFVRGGEVQTIAAPKAVAAGECGPLGCPIVRRNLSLSVERQGNAAPVARHALGHLGAFLRAPVARLAYAVQNRPRLLLRLLARLRSR